MNRTKLFAAILYTKFIEPKSHDEDMRRREFLLNVLLLGSITLLSFLNGSVIYDKLTLGKLYVGISPFVFLGVLLTFILLYALSRLGLFIYSSYILIVIYFFSISYAAYHWGVDLPTALLSFAMLIAISSVLINTRFGLRITLVISLLIITLGSLESASVIHPIKEWKAQSLKYDDGVEYAIVLLIIMVVSWLSNRETERSLERARRSERALMAEKELLELKVEERTGQLRDLQMKRVTELHDLAEMGKSAGGFFHDLMNPLTGLVLAVEKLNDLPENKKALSSHLDQALSASRRMEKFIQAIRRRGEGRAETLSLPDELNQAVQLLEYKARKSGVKMKITIAEDIRREPAQAHWDFYKIVYNLIAYALDHATGTLSIILNYHGENVVFELTYPGAPLPELESAEQSGEESLGLLIAKNLLEKAGGALKVRRHGAVENTLEASFPQY